MIPSFASRLQNRLRRNRAGLLLNLSAAVLLLAAAAGAQAQFSAPPPGTQVHDASALHPPAGARVAIFEFSDLQCPQCAFAYPLIEAAVEKYKIPWLYHDFVLPYHTWSTSASINVHWFNLTHKGLGDEYRKQVFANQSSIYNPEVLHQFTDKFAKEHGIAMPFAIDPQGKLATEVKADTVLGQRIGIDHTPTIWVVTANSKGAPYIEVTDTSKLYQIIDQALADTAPAAKPAVKKATAK
jgi:protein-disulfide isomerase